MYAVLKDTLYVCDPRWPLDVLIGMNLVNLLVLDVSSNTIYSKAIRQVGPKLHFWPES